MSGDSPQVQAIFLRVLETAPFERDEFLDQQCGDDADLRRRVEALLSAQDRSGSFLDSPFSERRESAETVAYGPLEQFGAVQAESRSGPIRPITLALS